jgi:hypothetical protein
VPRGGRRPDIIEWCADVAHIRWEATRHEVERPARQNEHAVGCIVLFERRTEATEAQLCAGPIECREAISGLYALDDHPPHVITEPIARRTSR